ncbi:aldehyde dehydrogenase family protein [Polycyclovorans algicola]|jgi:aldehyde dehydrogenase|uniref:aldehyde dehydrogenase family protein n=1 Tax=Polycyclovorans algicola TaxID=616992 RepID=UPI0004A7521F|nr:aldehyde dehydrogenase family protein [Polycyclovorans algicola]
MGKAEPTHTSTLYQAEYGHFINGKWEGSASGEKIGLYNPATGALLSSIQSGNAADAVRAVEAASAAFPSWKQSRPQQRQEILFEMARRMRARIQDYAMLESLNNGKPLMEAMHFDLPMAIEQFEMFAGSAFHLHGESISTPTALGIVHREPLGVCAQIIPWNVPLIMMAAKIAPALAAGNTIVLKPSEIVCLGVMEFFKQMADIIPPGVVNVITGYGPNIGEALVTHPKVRKVAFTGSRPTAQKLIQYASVNVIPQTMELGGKSANIVCEDADLDAAAEGAAMSVVLNKGEVCLAGSRVFVHEKIKDAFLEKFQANLRKVKLGDPTDPTTQMGPQASKMQLDKISSYLELGPKEGATLLMGGKAAKVSGFDKGYFIEPTIFTDVKNNMRIAQEEIFGPVSTVITWKDDEEVVRMANDTTYGLGGGLWTQNLRRAHKITQAIETGTIWVNRYYNFVPGMPVGGYKQSGFGREFAQEVLHHYTLTKSVIINLEEGSIGVFGR